MFKTLGTLVLNVHKEAGDTYIGSIYQQGSGRNLHVSLRAESAALADAYGSQCQDKAALFGLVYRVTRDFAENPYIRAIVGDQLPALRALRDEMSAELSRGPSAPAVPTYSPQHAR